MAVRKIQPLQGSFATIVALTSIAAAPVLAAPDRSICEESAAPTLDVATTEFSVTTAADTDESIELLGPNFEFASREKSAADDNEPEQAEPTADDSAEEGDATIPAEAGPLVHKRQMYRRDI